jgi:hypothetical protein
VTVDRNVIRIARAAVRGAATAGADAVVMSGSHARGDGGTHSDIDLIAIFRRRPPGGVVPPYSMRGGHLVSVAATTAADVRAALRDPARFTTFVPGWREAVILHDPSGIAARIQRLARAWTWGDELGRASDAWVAQHITGWAEEVHKLAGALERGERLLASTQRSLLAVHLAGVVAMRHRLLFGTDNVLWEMVAREMGEPWASVQAEALSQGGESVEVSCRATLRLYALAAADAWPLLDHNQRAVVRRACEIAGHPFPRKR